MAYWFGILALLLLRLRRQEPHNFARKEEMTIGRIPPSGLGIPVSRAALIMSIVRLSKNSCSGSLAGCCCCCCGWPNSSSRLSSSSILLLFLFFFFGFSLFLISCSFSLFLVCVELEIIAIIIPRSSAMEGSTLMGSMSRPRVQESIAVAEFFDNFFIVWTTSLRSRGVTRWLMGSKLSFCCLLGNFFFNSSIDSSKTSSGSRSASVGVLSPSWRSKLTAFLMFWSWQRSSTLLPILDA